jgi:hypothetical protein
MSASLLRVPVSRRCYADESPLGYLIEMASLNAYGSIEWLMPDSNKKYSLLPEALYPLLRDTNWSGFDEIDELSKTILKIDNVHMVTTHMKYCPTCLQEKEYWRFKWNILFSVACLKHRVYLEDTCPHCRKRNGIPSHIAQCDCGTLRKSVKVTRSPSTVLRWQAFLEDVVLADIDEYPSLINEEHDLSMHERIAFIRHFVTWSSRLYKVKSNSLRDVGISNASTREMVREASRYMFGGRAEYRNFLLTLMAQGKDGNGNEYRLFTEFYRRFSEICISASFKRFYVLNDEFVDTEWKRSLSRRNRTFRAELRESHQWIPFQVACKKYGIHRSVLRRVINEFQIEHTSKQITKRKAIDIFQPALEKNLYRIKDRITATEAAAILGVTKLQFSELRSSECFKDAVPPKAGYCQEWQFSRDEMIQYLETFVHPAVHDVDDVISVSHILKYHGGNIENPLHTILKAIKYSELKCHATQGKARGIRGLLVSRREFLDWYLRYKDKSRYMTLIQAAKRLGVNQEIAYQLLNHGLLECTKRDDNSTRWIHEGQFVQFNSKYVFLSKISKATEIGSRILMRYLAGFEIYPVDKEAGFKLRQKLYLREDLVNVTLLEPVMAKEIHLRW